MGVVFQGALAWQWCRWCQEANRGVGAVGAEGYHVV